MEKHTLSATWWDMTGTNDEKMGKWITSSPYLEAQSFPGQLYAQSGRPDQISDRINLSRGGILHLSHVLIEMLKSSIDKLGEAYRETLKGLSS